TTVHFGRNRVYTFIGIVTLHKFGWKSMLSQSYGDKKEKLLNHCTNDSDNNHNDHLHIQGFAPTLKET
ncbi:MAG: hypothetical protein WCJ72_07145, partial [Chryseobacterium sp.]